MEKRPYVQTRNQGMIDLLDPKPEQIVFNTCVHALTNISRYTGHVGGYSVAEHSVHTAAVLDSRGFGPEVVAGALLHDFHEAWFGDMSSPMKEALNVRFGIRVQDFEDLHKQVVEERFGVCTSHPAIVQVDMELCITEVDLLLGGRVGDGWPDAQPIAAWPLHCWSPFDAVDAFYGWADRLGVEKEWHS